MFSFTISHTKSPPHPNFQSQQLDSFWDVGPGEASGAAVLVSEPPRLSPRRGGGVAPALAIELSLCRELDPLAEDKKRAIAGLPRTSAPSVTASAANASLSAMSSPPPGWARRVRLVVGPTAAQVDDALVAAAQRLAGLAAGRAAGVAAAAAAAAVQASLLRAARAAAAALDAEEGAPAGNGHGEGAVQHDYGRYDPYGRRAPPMRGAVRTPQNEDMTATSAADAILAAARGVGGWLGKGVNGGDEILAADAASAAAAAAAPAACVEALYIGRLVILADVHLSPAGGLLPAAIDTRRSPLELSGLLRSPGLAWGQEETGAPSSAGRGLRQEEGEEEEELGVWLPLQAPPETLLRALAARCEGISSFRPASVLHVLDCKAGRRNRFVNLLSRAPFRRRSYTADALLAAPGVLGSLELLLNPTGLLRALGGGLQALGRVRPQKWGEAEGEGLSPRTPSGWIGGFHVTDVQN